MNVWACIGSGPSLHPDDVDFCRAQGWKLATVNMGFTIVPDAAIFHAMDSGWWERYGPEAVDYLNGGCEIWTGCPKAAQQYDLNLLTWDGEQGYSHHRGHCHGGKLSGIQLINIVGWHMPDLVVLLGYDNRPTLQRHWHPDYPKGMRNSGIVSQKEGDYAKLWSELPFSVINCSRDTVITDIPRATLDTVYQYVQRGSLNDKSSGQTIGVHAATH